MKAIQHASVAERDNAWNVRASAYEDAAVFMERGEHRRHKGRKA